MTRDVRPGDAYWSETYGSYIHVREVDPVEDGVVCTIVFDGGRKTASVSYDLDSFNADIRRGSIVLVEGEFL